MFKRALAISMAFIGLIVGAGFASGQEALQYFVAFGTWGIVGAVVASALMIVTGVAILQLGSYFQASEHTAVLSRISGPVTSKILDFSTIATLFCIGFVMFAGGGSNLQQQFGWPAWIGATIMLVLVMLTGMLDVNKVSAIIGAITPFVIVFIVCTTIWTIVTSNPDWSSLNVASESVVTTLPNWWLSALNYIGLAIMTAVSMAIVIGGNNLDTRAAGLGGLIGGLFFLLMLMLLVVSLFIAVETVGGEDMPVLALINEIHPTLGFIMTFVVFGMIFNTAIGMFYALGKRLTRGNPSKFRVVFLAACLIGFGLSFFGFRDLVSYVYPVLGYLGILMMIVISIAWFRGREKFSTEGKRRVRARKLLARKLDPRKRFTKKNQRELARLTDESNVPDEKFRESLIDEIASELESDPDVDYDRNDPPSNVVYVQHTKPTANTDGSETTNHTEVPPAK
ncbi:YkvI family membrane protein [Corynebacterium suedekumii]|uniref:Membrane protein YkvI n=1 Tax=Corynebacterium suedekumii TaxID=3049801 RepID=A0ABY8VQ97_9CORY|nr:hypothetical protein [Corynebacterium suedekumii]WIM71147.1 hypothetical protein QP029_04975 [Corynebacterium suedekumii]